MSLKAEVAGLIRRIIAAKQEDLFVFSGPIDPDSADTFVELVCRKEPRRKKAGLILTTYGGDAHSAYRIVRALKRRYGSVRVLVPGYCKSAGTLIAIGANELAFGVAGELGPLDVQMRKQDDIMVRWSGLDAFQALAIVTGHAFNSFERYMLQLSTRSGGNISTRTACEIASQFVTGLFTPIAAQIDPFRLGEVQRAINIAKAYGERLGKPNAKPDTLERVVEGYPAHAFVIDLEEARDLFLHVGEFDEDEASLCRSLRGTRNPSEEPAIYDLEETATSWEGTKDDAPSAGGVPENPGKDDPGDRTDTGEIPEAGKADPQAGNGANSGEGSAELLNQRR